MVDVAQSTGRRIDLLLGSLLERWRAVPRVADEIDGWDLLDQLDYTESWVVEDERLAQLDAYAAQGLLSDEQDEQYRELRLLVTRNEPTLRQLLHD
jgi:hypothetical protein